MTPSNHEKVRLNSHYKIRLANQAGVTLLELIVAITVAAIMLIPTTIVTIYFYGSTVTASLQSRLAVESQNILRSMVEELRVSSGVRDSNTITDANAPTGGWTTSEASLVLIISTPVTDNSNDFVIDTSTGEPYQNELVYFVDGNNFYKRYLANASASGNRFKTSCPAASATASCPPDVLLSTHFKDMTFVFYDQDDAVTTTLVNARSIEIQIEMEQKTYGRTINFENNIRITMRNSL